MANWLLGQNVPSSHKILVASIRLELVHVFKHQLDLANVRANVRHVVPVTPLSSEHTIHLGRTES
jgi:hypothetical protein